MCTFHVGERECRRASYRALTIIPPSWAQTKIWSSGPKRSAASCSTASLEDLSGIFSRVPPSMKTSHHHWLSSGCGCKWSSRRAPAVRLCCFSNARLHLLNANQLGTHPQTSWSSPPNTLGSGTKWTGHLRQPVGHLPTRWTGSHGERRAGRAPRTRSIM